MLKERWPSGILFSSSAEAGVKTTLPELDATEGEAAHRCAVL
jgi:hypothetical protein